MNVYDFDNTILRGDSTALFYAYCLRHCPKMWRDMPAQLINGLLFVLKLKPKQAFKQRMLGFLRYVDDIDATVEAFWKENFRRVKPFYAKTYRPDDVIISASPEFLIRPACEKLKVGFIMGSPVNRHTGEFSGLNCHGREKVRRYLAVYPDVAIDSFYSDSLSDTPLAEIAANAILVKGDTLLPWPKHE